MVTSSNVRDEVPNCRVRQLPGFAQEVRDELESMSRTVAYSADACLNELAAIAAGHKSTNERIESLRTSVAMHWKRVGQIDAYIDQIDNRIYPRVVAFLRKEAQLNLEYANHSASAIQNNGYIRRVHTLQRLAHNLEQLL